MHHLHPMGDRNGRQEFNDSKPKSLVNSERLRAGNLGPLLWGQESPVLLPWLHRESPEKHFQMTFPSPMRASF